MIDTLEAALSDAHERMADAARNRRSPMHTPAVATADADLRVMVLRAFDADAMTVRFHTDARAPKARLIGGGAAVGVLFYDKEAGLQLRCRGVGRIEAAGDAADAAWRGSAPFARRCYLGDAPGTPSPVPSSGLPEWIEGRQPDEEQLLPARANFAVLLVELEELDWYRLAHTGHRRALFRREDGWQGEWLTP